MFDKKDDKVYCMSGCGKKLENGHIGIKCENSCNYCIPCSQYYAKSLLDENVYPFKCFCKAHIVLSTLERQLNQDQLKLYFDLILQGMLFNGSDIKMDCPHCSYFELWDEVQDNFFQCKHINCSKISCSVCKSELPKLTDQQNQDKNQMQQVEDFKIESYDYHFKCKELEDLFKKFNDVYQSGITRKCPECDLIGHKNDACNKMICPRCNTIWCQVCELSEDKADKEKHAMGQFYTHFDNWKKNKKRCPMHFEDLKVADARQKNAKDCLQLFHQLNLSNKLKLFIKKIGLHEQVKLYKHVGSVANCGFTLEELQEETKNLFQFK